MSRLPKRPSKLLLVALRDLRAIEQDSRYTVDMRVWHNPEFSYGLLGSVRVCEVCLAGAVIARSFRTPIQRGVTPGNLTPSRRRKLYALDAFRQGCIHSGLHWLQISSDEIPPELPLRVEVVSYHDDRDLWHKQMFQLVRRLQRVGL